MSLHRSHPQFISSVVAIAILSSIAGSGLAAVVRIKDTATVKSAIVRLGDVADISDSDAELVKRLEATSLVPAPAAGGRTRIDFATIRSRLRAQGIDLANVDFSGRSAVTVSVPDAPRVPRVATTTPPKVVPRVASWQIDRADRLVEAPLRQFLRSRLPQDVGYTVEVKIDPSDVPSILSAATTGYQITGGRAPWDAWQAYAVRFLDRKEVLQQVSVKGRVRISPYVVGVRYTVPRGHILKTADLVWKQATSAENVVTKMEDAVGREAKRTLRKDEPIRAEDIRQVPLVHSNDIITVHASLGGIVVKRQMKARGDGAHGDAITVVSLDGRQTMPARVTGFHEAQVLGTGAAKNGSTSDDQRGGVRFLPRPAVRSRTATRFAGSNAPDRRVSSFRR